MKNDTGIGGFSAEDTFPSEVREQGRRPNVFGSERK
jgi:hypothetical protein